MILKSAINAAFLILVLSPYLPKFITKCFISCR